MRDCFRIAERGKGFVSPNPLVGAVLTKGSRVLARGFHRSFGGPHAEIDCIRRARGETAGATLHVNLEPCTHYGKTPPCVDEIVRAGIREVYVAISDPNPLVSGRGIRKLRAAGVTVHVGLLGDEARKLNRVFVKHMTLRRPYIHVKIAQSLDGKIAAPGHTRRWITSRTSRALVHSWRAETDAVLVGAGTVRYDDPRLTTHRSGGRDPQVVILDGRLKLPLKAHVLRSASHRRVIVCTSIRAARARRHAVKRLRASGVLVLPFRGDGDAIPLRKVLRRLYRLAIGSVMVEGGKGVFTQFLREGLVDELSLFIAPRTLGRGVSVVDGGVTLQALFARGAFTARSVGGDLLVTGIMP